MAEQSARAPQLSLSLVVCVADDAALAANLLSSPCLGRGSGHDVIAVRSARSADAGLRMGLARARTELVVLVHRDVFLPTGWDRLMVRQHQMAEREFGPIGVAGVYGVGDVVESTVGPDGAEPPALRSPGAIRRGATSRALAAERIGWVYDRGRVLREGPGLPVPRHSAFPREGRSGHGPDPL